MATPTRFLFGKEKISALPLPAPGARAIYYDTEVRGLQLRVSARGTKTFGVFKRIAGRPERVTLGRNSQVSVEQARKLALKVLAEVADGSNPAAVKRAHRAELTFGDLFDEYLIHAKTEKRSWRDDESRYNVWVKPVLGKLKLRNVTPEMVKRVRDTVTKAGKPSTANRVVALMSGVFSWAIREGLHDRNPVKGTRRNREYSRERFLQPNELPRFFEALREELNTTLRDFILMALLTGQRRGNVLAMRWADLSMNAAEWRIPMTKNGTAHTVPLTPEALEILHARRGLCMGDYVFPARSGEGHLKWPYKGWDALMKRAKLENLRIHDLRRSMGSWQARTGASLALIGKTLNHKDASTTLIYARLDVDPVREAMQKATNAMMSAAKVKPEAELVNIKRERAANE